MLMQIFVKNFDLSALAGKSKESLAVALQDQVKSILFSIMSAAILGFIIIYSLSAIMERLNAVLLSVENGAVYSILFFVFLALTSSVIAVLFFKSEKKVFEPETQKKIDLQNILISFLDGFSKGFEEPTEKQD